jgi:DNA-binding transcriptional LysR family regulator
MVVASPELLERIGKPRSLGALQSLPRTVLIDRNTGRHWPWMFSSDRQLPAASPSFVTNDPEAECEAVVAGLGIGQLASYLALPHVRSGELVELLGKEAPTPTSLYVYRARRSPVTSRVRLVYERLLEALGGTHGMF